MIKKTKKNFKSTVSQIKNPDVILNEPPSHTPLHVSDFKCDLECVPGDKYAFPI